MRTPESARFSLVLKKALSPKNKEAAFDPGQPRDNQGRWSDGTAPPHSISGMKSPTAQSMVGRIGTRQKDSEWGYFGSGTNRNKLLDMDTNDALRSMGVSEGEAEEFLTSRMGRHYADAVHHLRPGTDRAEVARQVAWHVGWYRKEQNRQKNGPSSARPQTDRISSR